MQAKSLIFVGLSLAVAACTSGGRSLIPNQQCPANFDPVPMKIADKDQSNKISWEKTTESLPPGDYQEVGATLYYVDDLGADTQQNFRLKLQESATKDGKFDVDTTAGCARNARPGLKLNFATEGVTRITIDNNKNVTDTETRMFRFDINDKVVGKFDPPAKKTGLDPKTVYQGKTTDSFILKRNDTDYELRSQGRYDNGDTHGTYFLLTTLRRAATPACPGQSPYVAPEKKIDDTKLPLTEVGKITPGTYTVESTAVYMHLLDETDNAKQNYQLQVQDKPTASGQPDSRVLCEFNAMSNLNAQGFVLADTISQLVVGPAGEVSQQTAPRRFAFKRVEGQSQTAVEFKPVASANVTGTNDVALKSLTGVPTVYRLDGKDVVDERIEIRSRTMITQGRASYNYDVVTILRRKL